MTSCNPKFTATALKSDLYSQRSQILLFLFAGNLGRYLTTDLSAIAQNCEYYSYKFQHFTFFQLQIRDDFSFNFSLSVEDAWIESQASIPITCVF